MRYSNSRIIHVMRNKLLLALSVTVLSACSNVLDVPPTSSVPSETAIVDALGARGLRWVPITIQRPLRRASQWTGCSRITRGCRTLKNTRRPRRISQVSNVLGRSIWTPLMTQ